MLPLNYPKGLHWILIIIVKYPNDNIEFIIQDSMNYDVTVLEEEIIQWISTISSKCKTRIQRRNDLEKSKSIS